MSKKRTFDLTTVPDPSKYPAVSTHAQSELLSAGTGGGGGLGGSRRGCPNDGAAVPPSSNTGALTPNFDASSLDNPLYESVSLSYPDGFAKDPTIDWVAFTVHPRVDVAHNGEDGKGATLHRGEKPCDPAGLLIALKSSIAKYFGGGEKLPTAVNGYKEAMSILGTGKLLWHVDRPEMGVHVVLPSSALHRWSQVKKQTALQFLADVRARGAKFTRLDLAFDTDQVRMAAVVAAHEAGQTVTRAEKSRLIVDYDTGGLSLYLGSRKDSRRLVRFYDKAAERAAKGEICELETWTRCEVEFKQEHAQTAVNYLLEGQDPKDLFLSSVDFRETDNEKTERRTPLQWWRDWVQTAQKVTFPVRKAAASVADSMSWAIQQCAPTFAWLSAYMGNTDWIIEMVQEALGRVPAWRWDLLPLPDGSLAGRA